MGRQWTEVPNTELEYPDFELEYPNTERENLMLN